MTAVGAKIKALRLRKGWSLSAVARKLATPASTYREWERGRKIPVQKMSQIASLHGVSMSELLGISEEKSESLKKAVYYLEAALDLVKAAQE